MEKLTLQQLINQTGEALVQAGASSYYQKVFKTLTKTAFALLPRTRY
nr:hypothetical protein [uncultured Oscillibacter sp.]